MPQLIFYNTITIQTEASIEFAWGAALVLVAMILVLNVAASVLCHARPNGGPMTSSDGSTQTPPEQAAAAPPRRRAAAVAPPASTLRRCAPSA